MCAACCTNGRSISSWTQKPGLHVEIELEFLFKVYIEKEEPSDQPAPVAQSVSAPYL